MATIAVAAIGDTAISDAAISDAVRQVSILSALAATGMLRVASRCMRTSFLRTRIMTSAEQLQMSVGTEARGGRQTAEDRQENHPRDDCGSQ
jgi:hypothetical protein